MATAASQKSFHDELYAIRISKRLPRKTVAARAGIDASYLAALERGSRNPSSPDKLAKIFDALGVTEQENARLSQIAFFTRLRLQIIESAPANICGEAAALATSIPRLTLRNMRLALGIIEALVADQQISEAPM